MANINGFLRKMAHDVFYGIGNTDRPKCPKCGNRMKFHGGDRAFGKGFWDCICDFKFTEADISAKKFKL